MIPDAARVACGELLSLYGYALDWLDEAALAQVFWPDAAIDYGFFRGAAEDFIPQVIAIGRDARRRFHLTNGSVLRALAPDLIAGDSLAITQSVRATDGGDVSTVFFGRYVDRFARRGEEWRIAARTYLLHGVTRGSGEAAGLLGAINLADELAPAHPLHLENAHLFITPGPTRRDGPREQG